MENKLYAFWKYDAPPYILGGEVIKIRDDGGIFIKGYDRYMSTYFKASSIIKIVPLEKGIKLQKKINKAHAKYTKTCKYALNELELTIKEVSK